jgi:hypothetical protein
MSLLPGGKGRNRRTGAPMRIKLSGTVLVLVAALSGCGGSISAPTGALSSVESKSRSEAAAQTGSPFAYVAEICETTSCPSATGLVQMLGGGAITSGVENPTTLALDDSGNLYVGNSTSANEGDISVYAPQGTDPLRILSGVVGVPKGLVADAAGSLFAVAQYRSGCCTLVGTGGVYAAGATKPHQHLKGLSGFAHSPVIDQAGNLYVGNFDVFPGWVSVYASGQHRPTRVINHGIGLPIQLAIAPNGDLVVVNGLFSGGYAVTVYPTGTSTPSSTITAGLHASTAVAVDADGNIYVANGRDEKHQGTVTVYRSGETTLWRTIRSGLTYPVALGFDSSGRLYVANSPRKGINTVVVYAAGASKPLHTYRLKEQFAALAVPH